MLARKDWATAKSLEMHKLAVALHFAFTILCAKHHTLGTTPAVALALKKNVSLEQVVEMTEGLLAQETGEHMNRPQHQSIGITSDWPSTAAVQEASCDEMASACGSNCPTVHA